MGSEQSHQRDVDVDTKAVESTAFWSLYNAELLHGDANADGHRAMTEASMFQSVPAASGGAPGQAPLDRAAKNLMVYRHPSILKFLKSSQRNSQTLLLTERCRPLLPHLPHQSDVQICLGLRSILCALVFLVEQAGARHLNISASSIYVTPAGSWRLAGFEHVWKAAEITASLLKQLQPTRKSADPNELKSGGRNLEQFAFAALCEQVLQSSPTGTAPPTPATTDFLHFCRQQLRHPDAASRPPLSACLQHAYFTHDFVRVHSFLTELPVKTAQDRLAFFTHLPERLRRFDERTVASQLAELLLSRMVLIDPTAQLALVPLLLGARTAHNPGALFEPATFRAFIVPRLVQLFAVRETQTRLTLLEYFEAYAGDVPEREMRDRVLPQLLLGIRDSNDGLVAATLRALAVLVPLVGAATVIGRNRVQIFADGRPQAETERRGGGGGGGGGVEMPVLEADFAAVAPDWMEARSITPVLLTAKQMQMQLQSGSGAHYLLDASESGGVGSGGGSVVGRSGSGQVMMLERLSPDGGEDEKLPTAASDGGVDADATEAAWSDWEADEEGVVEAEARSGVFEDADDHVEETECGEEAAMVSDKPVQQSTVQTTTKAKSKAAADTVPEIDFFADMEPVIEKTNVLLLEAEAAKSRLRIQPSASDALVTTSGQATAENGDADDGGGGGGWGDDLDGWDDG